MTDDPNKVEAPHGMVRIVITVPHTYLHLDEHGDGRADWATTSEPTIRVEKRTRLRVPADLAKLLSKHDQAEIL